MSKFVIRKYAGDDPYSWAVFYKSDLKRIDYKGPVMAFDASPIIDGLTRSDAQYHKKQLEEEGYTKR